MAPLATPGYAYEITVRNANKSMLLGYISPRRLAKLQYIFASTFCDLQMPRYGRQKDSPNFVSTWDFLFKPVFMGVSIWSC